MPNLSYRLAFPPLPAPIKARLPGRHSCCWWISDGATLPEAYGTTRRPLRASFFVLLRLQPSLLRYQRSSGAGRRHQKSHVLVATGAGAFPSFVCRIADTPSSQRTDDSVLSLTSSPAWWSREVGTTSSQRWQLRWQRDLALRLFSCSQRGAEVLVRQPTAGNTLFSLPFVSTTRFCLELCARRKSMKKESCEKADFGAKKISKEKKRKQLHFVKGNGWVVFSLASCHQDAKLRSPRPPDRHLP